VAAGPLLSVPPVTGAPVAVAPPPVAATEETGDECRRTSPRLKLPPMFHMDSGSSFEGSYEPGDGLLVLGDGLLEPGDGLLQHQLLKVLAVAHSLSHYLV